MGGGTKKTSLDLEAYPISHIAAVTWIFYVLVGSMLLKNHLPRKGFDLD